MYPVKLGFDEALDRIKSLLTNGHSAEALVTSVFTVEKTVHRALKFTIVARGFTNKQAEVIIGRAGFDQIKTLWPCFDPHGATLPTILGNDSWIQLTEAVKMRNKLVHGTRAFALAECKGKANKVLGVLTMLQSALSTRLGTDGWTRLPIRRRSALQWIPFPKKV